jgi:hypothetical protein
MAMEVNVNRIVTETDEAPGILPFIDRPMFTHEEAKRILDYASKIGQTEHFVSPSDIIDDVATALRETLQVIAWEEFEEVTARAIG